MLASLKEARVTHVPIHPLVTALCAHVLGQDVVSEKYIKQWFLKNWDCIVNVTPAFTYYSKKTIHSEGAYSVVHDEPVVGGVESSDNFQYKFNLKERPAVVEPPAEDTLKRRALSVEIHSPPSYATLYARRWNGSDGHCSGTMRFI